MVLREKGKITTSSSEQRTAEPDSTAPQGKTAPQNTAQGAGRHNRAHQNTRQQGGRPAAGQGHQRQNTPLEYKTRQPDPPTNTGSNSRHLPAPKRQLSTAQWRHITQHKEEQHNAPQAATRSNTAGHPQTKCPDRRQRNRRQQRCNKTDNTTRNNQTHHSTQHHEQKQPRLTHNSRAKHRGKQRSTQQRGTAPDNTPAQQETTQQHTKQQDARTPARISKAPHTTRSSKARRRTKHHTQAGHNPTLAYYPEGIII